MPSQTRRSLDSYLSLLVLALVVFAQGTLFSRLRLFDVGPNLLLVTTVCWSLVQNMSSGLI